MIKIEVSDVAYGPAELRDLAAQLAIVRNGALEAAAMDWAVILSHSVGVLNVLADQLGAEVPKTPPEKFSEEDLEDWLDNEIVDSLDVDWTGRVGARYIIYQLRKEGRLDAVLAAFASTEPNSNTQAPEGA